MRIRHARAVFYCSSGMRAFFERHDLDWGEFLKNGIPAETLEATGDYMAIRVAEKARGE